MQENSNNKAVALTDEGIYSRMQSGDKSLLNDIYVQYKPKIDSKVKAYGNSGLPSDIVDLQAKAIVAKSLKNYNPEKGAFATHLEQNLQSLFRETNKANVFYIPDSRASLYGKFSQIKKDFFDGHKRMPTPEEMADIMKINVNETKRLFEETSKHHAPMSSVEDIQSVQDHSDWSEEELLRTIHKKIDDPRDALVFEYTFGLNGKEPLSTNDEIALKLGISEGSVRYAKDRIIKLMDSSGLGGSK